jgi:hypothetical protein
MPTNNVNKQWISAGVDRLDVEFYDADGIFSGGHGTLQRGEISSARRWQGIKTASVELPARNKTTVTGDDVPQGVFSFDRTDSAQIALQSSNRVQGLESEIVGLNDYTRNQYRTLLFDPKLETTQNVGLIIQSQAKSSEYGTTEQPGWQVFDIFKGEIDPGAPTGLEEQTGHAVDFTMTVERQSVYPDNVAITTANEGTDEASGNIYGSKYRFTRTAMKGDGTLTEINLPVTPAADHTDLDIYAVEITKRTTAGVTTFLTPTTDYTVTTSPPRVTLASAALYDERYTITTKFIR